MSLSVVVKKPRKKVSLRKAKDNLLIALWSAAVRIRDGYVCQYCGTPTKRAEAHHIFTRTDKSTRYDPDNGVTLCWYCHHYRAGTGDFQYWVAHEWLGLEAWEALYEKTKALVKANDAWYDEQEKGLRAEIEKLQDKTT